MPQRSSFIMLRQLLPAVCVGAALLGYAAPAAAGPLCAELSNDFDINFDEDGDESTGGVGDATDLNGDDTVCRDFAAGDGISRFYLFDVGEFEHLLRVTVDQVLEPFGLAFELVYHPEGTDFGVNGYTCLPYVDPADGPCVEYQSVNQVEGDDYAGLVWWLIAWTTPIGSESDEIVHAPGDTNDFAILTENNFFDPDGTPRDYDCDSPYFSECGIVEGPGLLGFKEGGPTDPARGATSNNFSDAAVVSPEPGTIALLGIALGGFALNRRRRG